MNLLPKERVHWTALEEATLNATSGGVLVLCGLCGYFLGFAHTTDGESGCVSQ